MSLLDREDPRGAPERHREALLRAEKRLDAAASDAVRAFLTKVRASVTPRSLTAATGGDFPQAAHLFALGEAQGWWQEAVDEHIAGEVAAAWRSGYFDTRDGDLLRSSQEAVGEYVANISDRLSRTATPTLPEAAFDKARVALSDEMARGSSTRETSQRLAAEFGWDEDARFWRGRKEELTGRIESILDPYGPPGTPDREWQRLNNAEVRDLQRQSSEATKHIDAVQSEWQTRADRIARTETTAAYNAGSLDAGKREGAGVKVWMANADDRTRETHLDASNECVPVDDAFDVGGVPMQMPGDPSAPPEETINCRCTVLFAASCEEADEMYPVMDPERAHEQALAEDRMREAPVNPADPEGIETGDGAWLAENQGTYSDSIVESAQVTREMLESEPWWRSADEWQAGKVPGLEIDRNLRPGVAGVHSHGDSGVTRMGAHIASDTPFEKFTIVTHEAGHALNAPVANRADFGDLIAPFRRPGGGTFDIDNPFGINPSPSEIIADAYSEVLRGRLAEMIAEGTVYESEWTLARARFMAAVSHEADRLGLPSSEIANRPRFASTLADAPPLPSLP